MEKQAPVDIIIRLLKQKADEAHEERLKQYNTSEMDDQAWTYFSGKVDACREMIDLLESIKVLFN